MSQIERNPAETQSMPWGPETPEAETGNVDYCPPEQHVARRSDLSRHMGRGGLGVLLSAAALFAAEPSTAADSPLHAFDPAAHSAPEVLPVAEMSPDPTEEFPAAQATIAAADRPTPKAAVPELVLGYKVLLVKPYRARPSAQWANLANGPSGLYVGQFDQSSQAQVVATTDGKDRKGNVYSYLAVKVHLQGITPFWECGWSLSSAVTREKGGKAHAVSPNPCVKQIGKLANPYNIGHDENCAPGKCVGGRSAPLTPECDGELYRNDRALDALTAGKSVKYARSIKHPLYDLQAVDKNSRYTNYRFRPLDGKTIDTMSNKFGWVLMQAGCVKGDPKGGPPLIPTRK